MKKTTIIVIAIACIVLICGGFYFALSNGEGGQEKELTEVEKLITKDLTNNYPKTPREVIKLYNRIMMSYYDEETTQEQLEDLVDQMMLLLDEEVLLVNDKDTYYASVLAEVALYAEKQRVILEANVCDSNEVKYVEDTDKDDEIAYVTSSYFVREKGEFYKDYQEHVLRKDAEGRWKLVVSHQIEGDDSDDE